MILEIRDPDGQVVYARRRNRPATQAVCPQAAFLVTDILQGNTDPQPEPDLVGSARDPATARTASADRSPSRPARPTTPGTSRRTASSRRRRTRARRRWPSGSGWATATTRTRARAKPAISLTAAAPLWHAFVRDLTAKEPVASFTAPKGVVQARIDAWTGGKPGPWTRDTTTRVVHRRDPARRRNAVDPPGLLYIASCGGWRVDPVKAELGPKSWDVADAGWLARRAAGRRRRRPVRHADRLLLGPDGLGRAALRNLRAEAEAGGPQADDGAAGATV